MRRRRESSPRRCCVSPADVLNSMSRILLMSDVCSNRLLYFTARDKATKNSFVLKLKIETRGEEGE